MFWQGLSRGVLCDTSSFVYFAWFFDSFSTSIAFFHENPSDKSAGGPSYFNPPDYIYRNLPAWEIAM